MNGQHTGKSYIFFCCCFITVLIEKWCEPDPYISSLKGFETTNVINFRLQYEKHAIKWIVITSRNFYSFWYSEVKSNSYIVKHNKWTVSFFRNFFVIKKKIFFHLDCRNNHLIGNTNSKVVPDASLTGYLMYSTYQAIGARMNSGGWYGLNSSSYLQVDLG